MCVFKQINHSSNVNWGWNFLSRYFNYLFYVHIKSFLHLHFALLGSSLSTQQWYSYLLHEYFPLRCFCCLELKMLMLASCFVDLPLHSKSISWFQSHYIPSKSENLRHYYLQSDSANFHSRFATCLYSNWSVNYLQRLCGAQELIGQDFRLFESLWVSLSSPKLTLIYISEWLDEYFQQRYPFQRMKQ